MKQQNDLLTRRVEKILPSKKGLKALMQKKKIRLFLGIDPTFHKLHLGHTIPLRKLMDFANTNHEVILLFGTGTVLVGDPSKRDTGRILITQKEIDKNIKSWKEQVSPIVDFNKIKIVQNSDWLLPLTLKEIIKIASKISAVQLFKRESFQRRIKKGDTVWYHETMYPLLQGYDSVVMDVDLEIGGTDQEFNMLMGRELQKKFNNKEKIVLTTPMISGTDGKQMSKSSGNCIWLTDSPDNMYGKLMRISDKQIMPYMKLLTDIPLNEIQNIADKPLENKKRLALDITTQFHGKQKALEAQKHFETTVQKDEIGTLVDSEPIGEKKDNITNILKRCPTKRSRSDLKRLVVQNGITIIFKNGKKEKAINTDKIYDVSTIDVIKVGKREFYKLKITQQ